MTQDALLSARKGLSQAQAFRSELSDEPDAAGREKLRRITGDALEAAARFRNDNLDRKAADETAGVADKTAELRRMNERRLPESLKDEPSVDARIAEALQKRDRGFSVNLDYSRAGKFRDAVAAGMNREELNLVVGTDDKGGYWTPSQWETAIDSQFRLIEGVSQAVTPIVTDHGRDIYVLTRTQDYPGAVPFTHATDVSTLIISEGGVYRTDAEPTYARAVLQVFKAAQKMPVSAELIEDAAISVPDEAAASVGQWLAQLYEQAWTNGTGSGQPKGVAHNPPAAQETTTAASGNPTIADVAKLLKETPGSRTGYSFLANRNVWADLVSGQGNDAPWAAVSFNDDGQPMVFGYPLYYGTFVSNQVSANANPIGFGDWQQYLATRVTPIRMTLSSLANSDTDEVVIRFMARFGGVEKNRSRRQWLSIST